MREKRESRGERAPQKEHPGDADACARATHDGPARRPPVQQPDENPDAVQATRGDDEAEAVRERRRAGREPRCRARSRGRSRRRPRSPWRAPVSVSTRAVTARPRAIAEIAIPTSTPGSGTPTSPRKPPKAIIIGNVTGSIQIAGAPSSCAPVTSSAAIAVSMAFTRGSAPGLRLAADDDLDGRNELSVIGLVPILGRFDGRARHVDAAIESLRARDRRADRCGPSPRRRSRPAPRRRWRRRPP